MENTDSTRRPWLLVLLLPLWVIACTNSKPGAQGLGGLGGLGGSAGAAVPSAAGSGASAAPSAGGSGGSVSMSNAGHGGSSGASGATGGAGDSSSHGGAGGNGAASGAGGAAGAAGGAGASANAGDCTRDLLRGVIDIYFAAMAAHDPSSLPQAASLKYTENTKQATLGQGLVWKTAGTVKFTRSLLDTERCGSVTEAVIPNSGTDTIFGLRLKLESQKITEVETIVVDPSTGFFPTPSGILNSKSDAWEDILPADQRNTREQLEAAATAYFASFGDSSVKPPYNMPCDRLENGLKTTQGDCSSGVVAGLNQPAQRYPVSDLEAGITAGFILFAGADIDFHMFKLIGGKIRWINAVVGPAFTSQGWP